MLSFVKAKYPDLLKSIAEKKALDETLIKSVKEALDKFKSEFNAKG